MAAPGPDSGGEEAPPRLPDLAGFSSVDWLLKKDRIFLLAQFWQQRATIAESELNCLKEQLASHRLKSKKEKEKNNNNNISRKDSSDSESNNGDVNEAVSQCPKSPLVDEKPKKDNSEASRWNSSIEPPLSDYGGNVSKLVEGISQLHAAKINELEEQLEMKNRLIHRMELEHQKDLEEAKRELGTRHDGVPLPSRSLENLLAKEHELKGPPDFGPLVHLNPSHLHPQLKPPLHPHLGVPLAPPPLVSPLQPLAPHPPPGTPFHHLLGEEWRRSLERSALDCHTHNSGYLSPDGAGDRGESPMAEGKSPPSLANGYQSERKSPFGGDSSPFKEDISPLSYKFEDRITGETLIPKGDPMEARLQEILRYNMEKYCHQTLDTLHISRRVRELLSIHNIGQRLFAKYVLGLSQGTVSELLSKPKPWDKLTEKGRDSYRKMHAWATDNNAVFLLKSLIPKKGNHKDIAGLRPSDDPAAEERIQHILSEASRAMSSTSISMASQQQQDQDARSIDSKSPASSTHSPSSPLSREARLRSRGEDMVHNKVNRMYHEELARLMTRSAHEAPHLPSRDTGHYPGGLFFPFLGQSLLFNRTPEEMKIAIDVYQQELSKLHGVAATGMGLGAAGLAMGGGLGHPTSLGMSFGHMHNGAQDLSLPKRDQRNGIEEDDEHQRSVISPYGNSLRPKTECPMTSSSPLSNLVTPITSIAAAVTSSDDMSCSGSNVSPLQRMASITNSLITAPPLNASAAMNHKPTKAVLPPITQQQFDQYSCINTEDIVKKIKEQLSQYSISQRLFGESVLGLSQGSVSDLLARPKPWHMLTQKGREPFIRMKMFLEDDNAVHKLVASQYKIAPEKLMRTGSYSASQLYSTAGTSKPHHLKLPSDLPKESPIPPVGIPPSLAGMPLPSHPPFFDTRMPVLDPLRKLFGEAVLGLSQGSVSELLSKPKPWHMLSIKGREPFIRMQLWLNDPHNIEKLQHLKNERREASKRRRALDPSTDISQDSPEIFQAPSPGGSSKKARVLFSEEQKEALRLAFALDPYPNLATIEFLSQELQLSTRTITNWFHNHRMRIKQNSGSGSCSPADGGSLSPPRDLSQPTIPFDPLHFRLLLSQRLLELRKEKGLPPTLPGFAPGLPPGLPPGYFPHFPPLSLSGFGMPQLEREGFCSGLDLSMKIENEGDESNHSYGDEDSNISETMSPNVHRSDDDCSGDHEGRGAPSPATRPSSSRRKPSAPQWVNPSWIGAEDNKDQEVIINGVCVMQTDDYRHREQETVLIEPTPVDESRRSAEVAEGECRSSPVRMTSPKAESPIKEEHTAIDCSNIEASSAVEEKTAEEGKIEA